MVAVRKDYAVPTALRTCSVRPLAESGRATRLCGAPTCRAEGNEGGSAAPARRRQARRYNRTPHLNGSFPVFILGWTLGGAHAPRVLCSAPSLNTRAGGKCSIQSRRMERSSQPRKLSGLRSLKLSNCFMCQCQHDLL